MSNCTSNYGLIKPLLTDTADVEVFGQNWDTIDGELYRVSEDQKVQKARMDTFTKLPSGSTTGDAELADIRVGEDGKTYNTAGEAVRNQIADVKVGTMKENLIDMSKLSPGWVQTTGEFNFSHRTVNYYRWEFTTDYISVTPSLPYLLSIYYDRSVAGWVSVCTYDSDKNFINRMFVNEHTDTLFRKSFTFSENVTFVRISYRSYMTAKIKFEQSTYPTSLSEETWSENLLEKRPLLYDGFIVDNGSIFPQTEDNYIEGYPTLLEKYTGFIPVTPGDEYTLYHVSEEEPWYVVGFYTSDGKGLTRISPANYGDTRFDFVVPESAHAMALSCRTRYLRDFALFRKTSQMCDGQRVREDYLNLSNKCSALYADVYANVKNIAHRGYSTEAPENTLSAYRLAKEKGFKYVECDVSFTSDNVAVLLHDGTVDRTSDGTGKIAELTLDQVKSMDFGSWKSAKYAGEKIPTFVEFIALCKYIGLHPYIELKSGTITQIKNLVSTVKRYGMSKNVTWISFDLYSLRSVLDVDANARLGYVVDNVRITTPATVKALKSNTNEVFIDCAHSTVNENAVNICMENDLPLEVWTVNNETTLLALDEYVTGVTSDSLLASEVYANY